MPSLKPKRNIDLHSFYVFACECMFVSRNQTDKIIFCFFCKKYGWIKVYGEILFYKSCIDYIIKERKIKKTACLKSRVQPIFWRNASFRAYGVERRGGGGETGTHIHTHKTTYKMSYGTFVARCPQEEVIFFLNEVNEFCFKLVFNCYVSRLLSKRGRFRSKLIVDCP